jgi:hypothetical protein
MPSVVTQIAPTQNPTQNGNGQYAPPNWTTQKALYSIIINNLTSTPPVQNAPGQLAGTTVAGSQTTMFVFDGIRLADFDQSCIPTQHPLQAGYNIADHAVLQPANVSLDVIMSDAIAAYTTGMWTGNPSKSVAAFQQMLSLMVNRLLVTLNTRLNSYQNMMLRNVRASDNQKNYYGLAMTLTFEQLFIGTISVQSNSVRSQTTGDTQQGQVNGQSPDTATLDQHTVTAATNPGLPTAGAPVDPQGPNNFKIQGSGVISSNNVTQQGVN